jgi:NAD(P)-dependent dehydrogenase (short-subunit alcohol dehydrogenase family)
MLSLDRKVAIITSGTSGIGARTAALFVEKGARVVIAGRRRERGEQLARTLGEFARFVPTDVAAEADVKAMIEQTIAWFGQIDCVVNNAGTGSQWVGVAEVDLDRFDAVIAVHVRGALAAMKHAVPIMAAQGSGSIITVASVSGVRAGLGGSITRWQRLPPFI